MGIDSFYTSPELADKLISYIPDSDFKEILDPCVGDGELLRAASKRWPFSKFWGSDVSFEVIKSVKSNHPTWKLAVVDFLSLEDILQSPIVKKKKDLILLNPPFTCKGATIHKIEYDDKIFNVSTAMFFLLQALKLLKANGMIYCILPISCCFSLKDNTAWSYLKKHKNATILESPTSRNLFKGCSPNIVLVSICNMIGKLAAIDEKAITPKIEIVEILRGKLSVYELPKFQNENGFPFIHTTNITDNRLNISDKKCIKESSTIKGPAILIPRVGRPSKRKIVKVSNKESYVLSDCLIALLVENSQLEIVYDFVIKNWEAIKATYIGTGAKYTTIDRLSDFFETNHT